MSTPSSHREPVEQLAEEFAARFRRGERPALTEYTEKYPELAEDIRELFPALVMMEQFGSVEAEPTGPFTDAAPRAPPKQLGEYTILREVGRGGMGVVYEAVQESLGRHVALKVFPGHALANPSHLERFRREARAAGRLHHTHIVPVFGTGECEGVYYYAMQFIQGQGLDAVLKDLRRLRSGQALDNAPSEASVAGSLLNGQFAAPAPSVGAESGVASSVTSSGSDLTARSERGFFRSVARVGLQVAEALAYAHRQGVLHRDIKPSNLLLDLQGNVWVTDFGLAKADDSGELTNVGDIVGTIRYMAPERFDGRSLPQSDIYSLGLTLYELLTLKPAFADSQRARLIERVLHEPPVLPRRVDPRVPRDLETIVIKCAAKEARDRYWDAETLAEDLRRYLGDRPILARRSSWREQAWRWCRRNPMVAGLAAAVLLLLVSVAVVSSIAAVWLKEERDNVIEAKEDLDRQHTVTKQALTQAEAAERKADEQLVQARLDEARARRWGGQAGRRFHSLEALAEAARIARKLELPEERLRELRNEAIACLALTDLRVDSSWKQGDLHDRFVAFDAPCERFITQDDSGTMKIRSAVDGSDLFRLPGFGAPVVGCVFSPDGKYLAVKYHTERIVACRVWDLSRREIILQPPLQVSRVPLDFSPDSRNLTVGERDGTAALYDLRSGKVLQRLSTGLGLEAVRFHPDGKTLATSFSSGEVKIWDLERSSVVRALAHPRGVTAVCWHPDGVLLGTACRDWNAYVWNAMTGQKLAEMKGHQSEVVDIAFNHPGSLLATESWDGTTRLWDPHTGKGLVSIPGLLRRFSPDDRSLFIYEQGAIGRWEVAAGSECRTLRGHVADKGPWGVHVSPDGRLVASAGTDGVRLWDIASGKELAFLEARGALSVEFNPDGKRLLISGGTNLHSCPIHLDIAAGRLRLGPPQCLNLPVSSELYRSRLTPDGRVLAVADRGGQKAIVMRFEQPDDLVVLGGIREISDAAISPDGQWLVTSTWPTTRVSVWDSRTKDLVKDLPVKSPTHVAFLPAGKYFATVNKEGCTYWEVGTWQPVRHIPIQQPGADTAVAAFSGDGSMLALGRKDGTVQLHNAATGVQLATLEPPEAHVLGRMCFSPDGSRLCAACGTRVVQVWDLALIRRQLTDIGLDWDLPPLPATREGERPLPPLAVQVDHGEWARGSSAPRPPPRPELRAQHLLYTVVAGLTPYHPEPYHLRGHTHERLGDTEKAIADFTQALHWQPRGDADRTAHLYDVRGRNYLRMKDHAPAIADLQKALDLRPGRATDYNALAWVYLTGPEASRDPLKALPLAERAIKMDAGRWEFHHTLGVTYYRLERWQDALASLETSVRTNKGEETAFHLFFLAMCHKQLGDGTKARDCFERGVRWAEKHKSKLPVHQQVELSDFHAEAEALLALQ
jgi:WD40 repeat protein/serine/threonine protein kinase